MAADQRMSIAFLAPHHSDAPGPQASRATPSSSLSSLSPPSLGDRDFICSRNDSHQGISRPAGTHVAHRPGGSPTRSQSSEEGGDQLRSPIKASPSPSPSPVTGTDDPTSSSFRRQPRSPRPTYSEEQRFFVMYARIIQDKSWPDIEEDFATIFKQRSKGGLCSLYYRIRRSWGLEDVLKSGSHYWALERQAVADRALRFSREFLTNIGYLKA